MNIWRSLKAGITRAFEKDEPERWATIQCNDYGRAPLDEPEPRVRYQEWAEREARVDAEIGG
jgi:hypothetical protein